MTPAAVWANAYTTMYVSTLEHWRAHGYELLEQIEGTRHTVRSYCQFVAGEFAEETRAAFLAANPLARDWYDDIPQIDGAGLASEPVSSED